MKAGYTRLAHSDTILFSDFVKSARAAGAYIRVQTGGRMVRRDNGLIVQCTMSQRNAPQPGLTMLVGLCDAVIECNCITV